MTRRRETHTEAAPLGACVSRSTHCQQGEGRLMPKAQWGQLPAVWTGPQVMALVHSSLCEAGDHPGADKGPN